ncbi:MAG TPA: tRNA uridine-5-carboxymethylaminomethyl(34) synthesis GTPase MnmE [Armatimonadota bacterium]|nr:tRNA uridine-5-carboxymethylaminomethyl(34) synthesis GTPase MnmE [Armatimonadota bacterium]
MGDHGLNPDTIVQRATPAGEGGLAVVRVSGPEARSMAEAVFRRATAPARPLRWRHAYYGRLVDPASGRDVDEVVLTLYAPGASFTGEAMAEIGCHAGPIAVGRVIELFQRLGARPAEPGEFSKRAFLNGRLDLCQAEAICDLVRARSDEAAQAALRQLDGGLSERVRGLRDSLMGLLAEIEVTIDFPDDDLVPVTTDHAERRCEEAMRALDDLLSRAEVGRSLREGVVVAIAGRPNVGKSSLLNGLLGRQRAIVTSEPGTTRDLIEEQITLAGIPFRLVDTAGLRAASGEVEAMGVDLALRAIETADICLVVLDASMPIEAEDRRVMDQVRERCARRVGVLNKRDLPARLTAEQASAALACSAWVHTSAIEPGGTTELERALAELVAGGGISAEGELLTNARHAHLMRMARAELDSAAAAAREGVPVDLVSIRIRAAAEHLGEITGETLVPELVDRIFSTFCLGK